MNEIKLNVAIQQFLVPRLCAILSMTEILDILSTKRQLIFAGLSLSLRGIVFLNIAMSTVECQCSREAAFFHA